MGHDYFESDDYNQLFDIYYHDEVFEKELFIKEKSIEVSKKDTSVQDKNVENKQKIKNPEEKQVDKQVTVQDGEFEVTTTQNVSKKTEENDEFTIKRN